MSNQEHPGWVNAERANDNALLDPRRISNVRLSSTEQLGGRWYHRYDFDYRQEGAERVTTLIAVVPADRAESFQEEVARAIAERGTPGWNDARRLAG